MGQLVTFSAVLLRNSSDMLVQSLHNKCTSAAQILYQGDWAESLVYARRLSCC